MIKIKYSVVILFSTLIVISISQIFSIPPFADDIFKIYKSGYFYELDRGFRVIKESFIAIKSMAKPAYGWIYIKDIEKEHKIDINIYNSNGYKVLAPGEFSDSRDEKVIQIVNSLNPRMFSEIKDDKYYSVIPFFLEDRCKFCHNVRGKKKILGVITFEREYNSCIYYSSERIILFVVVSLLFSFLLYLVLRWDPEKTIKELFDK